MGDNNKEEKREPLGTNETKQGLFDAISTKGKIDEFYNIGQKIGKGAFSTVYEAVERTSKQSVAVKAINKRYIKTKLLEREIAIMTKLHHSNILHCKEVFETESFIYLVLELVKGGELYDKIVEEGEYTEEETKLIILQVLDAVEYLHDNGIAHRDLKPENILCVTHTDPKSPFRNEQIKVADFGLSKMFSTGDELISQCGSPTYVAPEVLMAKPYTEAVDMWAIGVITFVLLTGCFPFFEEGHNYSLLYQKIINVDYSFPDEPSLSKDAQDFIRKLLAKDPATRLTPQQCRRHPWLKNSKLRK